MVLAEKLAKSRNALMQPPFGLHERQAEQILDPIEFFLAEASVVSPLQERDIALFKEDKPEEEAIRSFLREAADIGRVVRTIKGRQLILDMMLCYKSRAITLRFPSMNYTLAPFEETEERPAH